MKSARQKLKSIGITLALGLLLVLLGLAIQAWLRGLIDEGSLLRFDIEQSGSTYSVVGENGAPFDLGNRSHAASVAMDSISLLTIIIGGLLIFASFVRLTFFRILHRERFR